MKQFFSRVKTVNKILFACLILMGGLVAFSFYKQKADIVPIGGALTASVLPPMPTASSTDDITEPDTPDLIKKRDSRYWSNVVIDQDGISYFVRRNFGKDGCEIVAGVKDIPLFCRESAFDDALLSSCGSGRIPDVATVCELVRWNQNGSQQYIGNLLDRKNDDREVDLLGLYKPGVLLVRRINPWPHFNSAVVYPYDIQKRLFGNALVEWNGGHYNDYAEMTKGDYTLVFHAWDYKTEGYKKDIPVGVWLINNVSGVRTTLNFPGDSPLSENTPAIELMVADNWQPSSIITFFMDQEEWSFNFETKKFSLFTTKKN